MPAAFPGVNCFSNGRACARSFFCHDAAPWGYSLYSQLLCSNKKIVEHATHFSNGKARENAKDSSIRPHEQRGVASPLPPFLIDKPPKSRSFLCDKIDFALRFCDLPCSDFYYPILQRVIQEKFRRTLPEPSGCAKKSTKVCTCDNFSRLSVSE